MSEFQLTEEMRRRAWISEGARERWLRFRRKLRRGEPVVYGAIGGSITEGAGASSPGNSYVGLLGRALSGRTCTRMVNAGIGASASCYAAFRAGRDLLPANPDLVTIEFAVNDPGNPDRRDSYEGLVRAVLEACPDALVILIFTLRWDGANTQADQIPIGRHYDLPMLSYRDAVWPEMEAGRLRWEEISPDQVHPNDCGHRLIFELLASRLFDALPEVPVLPAPLSKRALDFVGGRVVNCDAMQVVANSGWEIMPSIRQSCCFGAETPGAELELEVEGRLIYAGYRCYAGDFGQAEASADGGAPQLLEGFFVMPPNNHGWRGGHVLLAKLVEAPKPGKHRLRFRLLESRHPESGGHQFRLEYLLVR